MGIAKWRGKLCKNGSHFRHDGGYTNPPWFQDKYNLPWVSLTTRDNYHPDYRKHHPELTLKQHLLQWALHTDRWDPPWEGWENRQMENDLFLAVIAAKRKRVIYGPY